MKTYELCLKNKFLTMDSATTQDMIDRLSEHVDLLKELQSAGFTDPGNGTRDDYATFYTQDAAVAEKFGFYDSLCDDEEDEFSLENDIQEIWQECGLTKDHVFALLNSLPGGTTEMAYSLTCVGKDLEPDARLSNAFDRLRAKYDFMMLEARVKDGVHIVKLHPFAPGSREAALERLAKNAAISMN
jgi:hypothetical protein